ncbi:MAG TPA: NADH:ubiquinone reductase (Na(+)-transporting) subunit D [Gammaproteobacteria bacterium]|nr:NADH:ubiquinone reductase (Na(+)-transporting) subunit D [Gammaproteobacteria bacterium]
MNARQTLFGPIFDQNPIMLQVLGICSALAITNSVSTALTMSIALTAVVTFANVSISLIRRQIPGSVRIVVQVTIIATGVIVVDEVLKAYAPDMARTLTVFVGLIVTNCIVLGRAESFAIKNGVWLSFLDGLGNGLGYSFVLIVVSVVRELFGAGTILGYEVLPLVQDGGWYVPNQMLLLPPSAFFIIGLMIWILRRARPEQVEKPEFEEIRLHGEEKGS